MRVLHHTLLPGLSSHSIVSPLNNVNHCTSVGSFFPQGAIELHIFFAHRVPGLWRNVNLTELSAASILWELHYVHESCSLLLLKHRKEALLSWTVHHYTISISLSHHPLLSNSLDAITHIYLNTQTCFLCAILSSENRMILKDDFQMGSLPWRLAWNMTARDALLQSASDDDRPRLLVLRIFCSNL